MGVYLGDAGLVEISRTAVGDGVLSSLLDPDDVNVARKRFSFDFDPDALITGDQIEIFTVDGSTLELVAGHSYPDGRWYAHIDQAGGIRLYDSFEQAVNGTFEDALDLVQPSRSIPIGVRTRDSLYRCIAQMRSWEMTTRRELIDCTSLGEEHRLQYGAGLISGQGTLACIWEYQRRMCDPYLGQDADGQYEVPHYFAQLVLRVKQGARFAGRFYLNASSTDAWTWWEADCIVTNVAMTFAPGQVVDSQIEFVTTGPIHLRLGEPPSYLLLEDDDRLLLEAGDGAIQLEENL